MTRHPQGELIDVYRCGVKFTASRRTVQHLDWTIKRLRRRYPWARLHIIQPCFHTGYAPSAGTHDFDCVFDVSISGITWRAAQRFLRNAGWFAWWRHTGEWEARQAYHIHMGSLPTHLPARPTADQVGHAYQHLGLKVGRFIDGGLTSTGTTNASSQVVDYMSVPPRDGLAGHADDNSWHPRDIPATAYVYKPFEAA